MGQGSVSNQHTLFQIHLLEITAATSQSLKACICEEGAADGLYQAQLCAGGAQFLESGVRQAFAVGDAESLQLQAVLTHCLDATVCQRLAPIDIQRH